MKPHEAQECSVWPRKSEVDTKNVRVRCHGEAVIFLIYPQIRLFSSHSIAKEADDLQVVTLIDNYLYKEIDNLKKNYIRV